MQYRTISLASASATSTSSALGQFWSNSHKLGCYRNEITLGSAMIKIARWANFGPTGMSWAVGLL